MTMTLVRTDTEGKYTLLRVAGAPSQNDAIQFAMRAQGSFEVLDARRTLHDPDTYDVVFVGDDEE